MFVLVVALIVYASLYPWRFAYHPLYLAHPWDAAAGSYLIHDIAVNIAIYIPLGLAAHFVMKGAFTPVLFATALATAIEFAQIYVPGRHAAIVDILSDSAGAVVGSSLGAVLRAVPPFWNRWRVPRFVAWIALLGIAVFRLASLEFIPFAADTFHWIPFEPLLTQSQQTGLIVLCVKGLAYTAAIGCFLLSDMAGWKATAVVTTAVIVTEVIRLFALDTYPGVTDPLIALLGGLVLSAWYPKKDAI